MTQHYDLTVLQEPAAQDEKAGGQETRDGKLLDAAAISAEARSAGVRTPKLPEVPGEEADAAEKTDKAGGGPAKDNLKEKGASAGAPADPPKKKTGGEEDEFEALARRFEALKKR